MSQGLCRVKHTQAHTGESQVTLCSCCLHGDAPETLTKTRCGFYNLHSFSVTNKIDNRLSSLQGRAVLNDSISSTAWKTNRQKGKKIRDFKAAWKIFVPSELLMSVWQKSHQRNYTSEQEGSGEHMNTWKFEMISKSFFTFYPKLLASVL